MCFRSTAVVSLVQLRLTLLCGLIWRQDGGLNEATDDPHRVVVCSLCNTLNRDIYGEQVVVRTDDLELAGEVVQDAAAYLGLTDLESTAHFPTHMQEFQGVLAKVSFVSEMVACSALQPDKQHVAVMQWQHCRH